jgi:hypothetical protein
MKNKLVSSVLLVAMLVVIAGCTSSTGIQVNTPIPTTSGGTPAPSDQISVPGFKIQLDVPGPNPMINNTDAKNRVAGILQGIWHGIISPVTLIISFINSNVQMYEVHNDGGPYNLGYLVGVAIIFLLLGVFAGRRRR